MPELDDEDVAVLEVLQEEWRVNPKLIRERTEIDKGTVNTALNRLAKYGYVRKITHGLYEVTDRGEDLNLDGE